MIVFETGTARGFSAVCMAKALADHSLNGLLFTVDILPHRTPIYWNCIDDHDRPKTREELLEPWSSYTGSTVFLTADSAEMLNMIHLPRIHFSFLDGAHTYDDVLAEFGFVAERQKAKDVILFDDVSDQFPGIQQAVAEIERRGDYAMQYFDVTDIYTVALAEKL